MKVEKKPELTLYPSSLVLVTSSYQGEDNIITLAWVSTVCFDPPLAGCAIRDTRHSHTLIKNSKEFVINIPSREIVKETDYCGQVSGKTTDKFADCNFTKLKASTVNAPLIKECPINIECILHKIVNLGTHDLFIGKLMAVHADEEILVNNTISFQNFHPVVYAKGDYWSLDEVIGGYGFSKKL
ncbi:MAG: flavin reductase family protein [Candidatus Methanofastidiosia archaeon]|jgi:flavin reductase (DIM6/NTAB) family NADH-FMN oxidoreductase RutF